MDFDHDSYSEKTENLKKTLTKERSIWHVSHMETLLRAFSPGERLILYGLTVLLGLSALALLAGLNSAVSVTIPSTGGTLVEGEIGPARFVNPILALSQADEDLSLLIYSGLTRALPSGMVGDLAESYTIGADGTTYTFTLRPDITFHDGTPLTADDVLFTIAAAQNPAVKSPRRADWEGVQVSSPDPRTVVFKLTRAYAPFIENTTIGILPKHIWQNVSAEEFPFNTANTRPVGSGPYRIERVFTDDTGSATRYELIPFSKFALGRSYLRRITFIFYPNQEALLKAFDSQQIDAIAGITPADLANLRRTDFNFVHVALPRVFGVFFNQSNSAVLADSSVRAALEAAINKQNIVDTVLGGYGVALHGPIPPGVIGATLPATPIPYDKDAGPASLEGGSASSTTDTARTILTRGGWTFLPAATSTAQTGDESAGTWTKKTAKSGSTPAGKLELSFALATADEAELVATAEALAKAWRAVGIKVIVQIYPLSELNASVIRPRQYDAILFGEVVGRTADLFAFWHSSQRNDPGLNLALYTNLRVDTLLSQARATTERTEREKLYTQFANTLSKDNPAIFLYAPEFLYLVPQSIHGLALGALTTPSERFLNVYQWYTDTEQVWSIFSN